VGDYKNPPPPGKYDRLHRYAKSLMSREPVVLRAEQRQLCVRFLVESLQRRRFDVVAASVSSNHFHILARFVDSRVDHWIGVAKRGTTHFMKQAELCPLGGIWAKYGKNQPIKDRQHQLATVRYILNHAKQGSAIWFIGQVKAAGACSRGSSPDDHFATDSIKM
jgi:REP element-mobilizing transposase RayT